MADIYTGQAGSLSRADKETVRQWIVAGHSILNGKVAGTIPSKRAATITPGTSDQVLAEGQYLEGAQTVKGDMNLVAGNIKSGVSIFGVTGTLGGPSNAVNGSIYGSEGGSEPTTWYSPELTTYGLVVNGTVDFEGRQNAYGTSSAIIIQGYNTSWTNIKTIYSYSSAGYDNHRYSGAFTVENAGLYQKIRMYGTSGRFIIRLIMQMHT